MDIERPPKRQRRHNLIHMYDGEDTRRIAAGDGPRILYRYGQLNMEVVHEPARGMCYLMGGFCIRLDDLDPDLEFYGISENGWNGSVDVTIRGDGRISIDPQIQTTDDDFIFGGLLNITPFNPVPYVYEGVHVPGHPNPRPTHFNLRDCEPDPDRYPMDDGL